MNNLRKEKQDFFKTVVEEKTKHYFPACKNQRQTEKFPGKYKETRKFMQILAKSTNIRKIKL